VRGSALAAIALGSLLLAGCGGGTRQNASEPKATYTVAVEHASFPAVQALARPTVMTLRVRNTSTGTIPNIAITVDSFNYVSNYPDLAANKRPIWAIEQGPGAISKLPVQSQVVSPPGGGQTAYVNTWALGSLAPGRAQTFAWRVTPVKPGVYTVHYTIAAGLSGNAKARLADGAIPHGHFTVAITPRPPAKYIDPNTGQVAVGTYPRPPYPTTSP
jgi:hypothetical protein